MATAGTAMCAESIPHRRSKLQWEELARPSGVVQSETRESGPIVGIGPVCETKPKLQTNTLYMLYSRLMGHTTKYWPLPALLSGE